jgi:hypothetical protein
MIVYVSADPSYGIPCECSKGLFDLPIYDEIHWFLLILLNLSILLDLFILFSSDDKIISRRGG